MTKQQVIDILEAYKPSGNIYNGYNSIEEKIDERICYLIDEIIGEVKREPDDDNKWIKCSEKMPEPMRQVLLKGHEKMENQKNNPTLKTIRQTAATGILPEHAIRVLVKQNKIPHLKVGNKVLIHYEKLCAMLNEL